MRINNLSLIIGTAACNAACPYCISKMTGIKSTGYSEHIINWRNFHKACRIAQIHQVDTVIITGKGEPTLYPHLITTYLHNIKPYDFPLIELQTNGLSFQDWHQYQPFLRAWYDQGLTTVSISIVHYDPLKNQSIYTPKSTYPDLQQLIQKLHQIGFFTRFSCTLLKNYIDSPLAVKNLINWTKSMQVDQLTLRPVAITSSKSESSSVYSYTKNHLLSQKTKDAIERYLNRHGNIISTSPHGANIYDIKDQNVSFANALTLDKTGDYMRQLIFFSDGKIAYDWQYPAARTI